MTIETVLYLVLNQRQMRVAEYACGILHDLSGTICLWNTYREPLKFCRNDMFIETDINISSAGAKELGVALFL